MFAEIHCNLLNKIVVIITYLSSFVGNFRWVNVFCELEIQLNILLLFEVSTLHQTPPILRCNLIFFFETFFRPG